MQGRADYTMQVIIRHRCVKCGATNESPPQNLIWGSDYLIDEYPLLPGDANGWSGPAGWVMIGSKWICGKHKIEVMIDGDLLGYVEPKDLFPNAP